MQNQPLYNSQAQHEVVPMNKVLKNTYALLGMTLLFSAVTAVISMAVGMPRIGAMVCSILALVLVWFVLPRTANSSKGLFVVFAFTGLLGAGLGPLLTYYLALPSGPALVAQALGGTALIFFALSAYALTTKKDFSFMGGFLMVGLMVILVAAIANIFLSIPVMSIAISAGIVLLMSGFILYDTSRIINGGETNYIMATVALYLDIYNLFTSLLQLLGAMGDD